MRTTLQLDHDLVQAARQLAAQRGLSMGQVISDLGRKSLEPRRRRSQVAFATTVFGRHGRPIKIDDFERMRLKITDYSKTPDLMLSLRNRSSLEHHG